MFKKAFTLAEMLIVILIIGVVSALTIPTLNQNTTEAQIGPKLAKAVSSLEQANMMIKESQQVDRLNDIANWNINTYITQLQNQLKVINSDAINHSITLKDNMEYTFTFDTVTNGASSLGFVYGATAPHLIPFAQVMIDTNGSAEPNLDATDRFYFTIMTDGSVIPYGAAGYLGNSSPANSSWNNATINNCANNAVPTNATLCAGSIFANNLKVLYQ